MNLLKTLTLIIIFASASFAVFDSSFPDAVSSAMGDIPSSIGPGPNSLFEGEGIAAGGGYRRSFNYADFDELAGWASWSDSKFGRALLNVSSYSVPDISSETRFALGYSRHLFADIHTELDLAVKANLLSLSYGESTDGIDLGSTMGASFDFAARALIYDRTSVFILVDNLTATNLGVEGDIEVPRAVTGAIGYSPYTNTNMVFHVRREAGRDFTYGLGISAEPHEIITFRLGAATNPDRITGGIGLKYNIFRFDYGLKSHPVLPLSHTINLGINLVR